jgi:hypothetical protein
MDFAAGRSFGKACAFPESCRRRASENRSRSLGYFPIPEIFCVAAAVAEFARPIRVQKRRPFTSTPSASMANSLPSPQVEEERGLSMPGVRMSAMTVIFVAVMGLSPCANAQTSGGKVLTLDEAIQFARKNVGTTRPEIHLDRQSWYHPEK